MNSIQKVLIVEDDDDFRETLGDLLESMDCQVVRVPHGKAAIEEINRTAFDLILTDVRMPEMDGLELLKWIKAHTKIPVILLTGFADFSPQAEARRLGADGFLPKPFAAEDLSLILNKIKKDPHE